MERIILNLETKGEPFTIDDIEKEYRPKEEKEEIPTFGHYVDSIITIFKETNKIGNSLIYKHTKNKFIDYLGKDIEITSISYRTVKEFEEHLAGQGLSTNGISIHLRTLRAIINRAIKDEIVLTENYAFKNYTIKYQKTRKITSSQL